MDWITDYSKLRLDIVGLVAVLGEGSVSRNSQLISLSWWSVLPRLMPAPQAIIEHERKTRLEPKPGTVAGAYSGMVKKEINFFTQLLHGRPPPENSVELVKVKHKAVSAGAKRPRSFAAREYSSLFWLSIIGAAMSAALFALCIYYTDGFGLIAVILLSGVSSTVGFAAHWALSFHEPPRPVNDQRDQAMPRSDLVIYYPNGAMRIIRTIEPIARLYFQVDHCEYLLDDTSYRTLALFATIMLMVGVVVLANAKNTVQIAFAAAYVILNALYWATSALDPREHHWVHSYDCQVLQYKRLSSEQPSVPKRQLTDGSIRSTTHDWKLKLVESWEEMRKSLPLGSPKPHASFTSTTILAKPRFTETLWVSIFLTGTSQWLNESTHIAPISPAWKNWLEEAERQANLASPEEMATDAGLYEAQQIRSATRLLTGLGKGEIKQRSVVQKDAGPTIMIPSWDYQTNLTTWLKKETSTTRKVLKSELPEDRQSQVIRISQESSSIRQRSLHHVEEV